MDTTKITKTTRLVQSRLMGFAPDGGAGATVGEPRTDDDREDRDRLLEGIGVPGRPEPGAVPSA